MSSDKLSPTQSNGNGHGTKPVEKAIEPEIGSTRDRRKFPPDVLFPDDIVKIPNSKYQIPNKSQNTILKSETNYRAQ